MTDEVKPEVTKVKKLMTLNVSTLGQLKAMEQSLASQDAKKLEDAVPDGHPLKAEIEKQKAIIGGDLSGLPSGHPLIRALQTAKESYEVRQTDEKKPTTSKAPTEEENVKIRRAKHLDDAKARRARYDKETQDTDETREAAKVVSKQVDEVLAAVRTTWEIVAGYEETLNRTPTGKVKLLRLKRILYATERGLSETRIGRV
jgi:hypothetical protein